MSRPETGLMKFEDDWTGVFIRGDRAFALAMALESVLTDRDGGTPFDHLAVSSFLELLKNADERTTPSPTLMKKFKDCVKEND